MYGIDIQNPLKNPFTSMPPLYKPNTPLIGAQDSIDIYAKSVFSKDHSCSILSIIMGRIPTLNDPKHLSGARYTTRSIPPSIYSCCSPCLRPYCRINEPWAITVPPSYSGS